MDYAFTNKRWITTEERRTGEEVLDRNGVGFRVSGFWDKVIDLNECHLQAEPSNAIRKAARDYALKHKLEFFDITKKKGSYAILSFVLVVREKSWYFSNYSMKMLSKERVC